MTLNAALGTPTYFWLNYSLGCDPIEINLLVPFTSKNIVQVYRIQDLHRICKHRCDECQPPTSTNYGAASLVWWPNSEAQKHLGQKYRPTDRQHGTLKPNSVNAVRLKNLPKYLKNLVRYIMTQKPRHQLRTP